MSPIHILYVTTKDIEQARTISRTLLERQLIACANIIPGMESLYRWQGSIQNEHEVVLILKTEKRLVEETTKAVLELHSYEVPCVLDLGVEGGSQSYLDWLTSQLRPVKTR